MEVPDINEGLLRQFTLGATTFRVHTDGQSSRGTYSLFLFMAVYHTVTEMGVSIVTRLPRWSRVVIVGP
jgi:hypothetical protein